MIWFDNCYSFSEICSFGVLHGSCALLLLLVFSFAGFLLLSFFQQIIVLIVLFRNGWFYFSFFFPVGFYSILYSNLFQWFFLTTRLYLLFDSYLCEVGSWCIHSFLNLFASFAVPVIRFWFYFLFLVFFWLSAGSFIGFISMLLFRIRFVLSFEQYLFGYLRWYLLWYLFFFWLLSDFAVHSQSVCLFCGTFSSRCLLSLPPRIFAVFWLMFESDWLGLLCDSLTLKPYEESPDSSLS